LTLTDLLIGSHTIVVIVWTEKGVFEETIYFSIAHPEPFPVLQILSFEEAVQASDGSSRNESRIIDKYVIYRNVQNCLYNESGVSGFLMWLSPDGILYEVGYPDGNTLWIGQNGLLYAAGFPDGGNKLGNRIGNTAGQSGWNPPDGYYIWNLNYGMEEEFWVLASNGTILLYNPPNFGPITPPTQLPTQPSIPYELIYGIALPMLGVVFCVGLLIFFKKRYKLKSA
jgi:hypothetical protein